MADLLYDSGKDAGKGLLAGLKSQEKALQAEMNKLGDGLVSHIRKSLDSNSPSRRTAKVGVDAGTGLALGLDSTAARVAASAAGLADAATPDLPQAGAGRGSTVAAGLGTGTALRLRVGEQEFTAYLEAVADRRVDAGFSRARRAQGAGRK
jgi:hypothetical protein